ncbi:uncharacterized protein LOC129601943 [Paramacrobiotus metropolitanus]|uniref:uncharacterized protein LOC129601943 n=1 Tax=Paramacrobiotus metropolitanus TaxID=2943436 RepID=UPI0024456612|nr:uncharacterized protein LOC129601943 [Paramacrobiotus metropolitanus]
MVLVIVLSFFSVFCVENTVAQLTTRQCSANASVVSSRCSSTNNVIAVSTCKTYCNSTTQSSTTLYSKFCASSSSCTIGSTCNIQSCSITLSGPTSVDVPCDYNNNQVIGGDLTISNGCGSSSSQFVVAEVIASNKADGTHYVDVDPTTGKWYRSATYVVTQNLSQTYEVTVVNLPSGQASNSINVTFNFGSCTFGLIGPDSARVCLGFPPGTSIADQQTAGSTEQRSIWLYPQLTFSATNVPPLMPVIFDLAKDAVPVAGLGTPNTANGGIYSPDVISNVGGDSQIFISNYNILTGKPNTDTIGIYGQSYNGNLPACDAGATVTPAAGAPGSAVTSGTCCQTLRFSVSPGVQSTPYQTGYKDVLVCYEDVGGCTYT